MPWSTSAPATPATPNMRPKRIGRGIIVASRSQRVKPARHRAASQREDEQHAAPARPPREVGERRAALAYVVRQVRGHVAGDEQSHVAADAGIDGDVLLAV